MRDVKWERVAGNSYMYHLHLAVGIYLDEAAKTAILIDSGANEKEAQTIDMLIQKGGYRVSAIIVTHGHVSQLGGLFYFKRKYDSIRVYASPWTSQFIVNRSLESLMMGAIPGSLQDAGMSQEDCIVTDLITYQDQECIIQDQPMGIVTLPGHFPGMLGVVTPDHVFYVADAIFGEHTLAKQKLLYYTNIQEAKASLAKIADRDMTAYVLTHGGKYESVVRLVEQHTQLIDQTSELILDALKVRSLTLENITRIVMDEYKIKNDIEHFALSHLITRSYLKQLRDDSKLASEVRNGVLYYYDESLAVMV